MNLAGVSQEVAMDVGGSRARVKGAPEMAQRCSRGSKRLHPSLAGLGATEKGQTDILSNWRKGAQRTSVKRLSCVMQV